MTSRVWADEIIEYLLEAGHANVTVRQDSPRTVRVIHDGSDPGHHLNQYAELLHKHGYSTEIQQPTDIRPLRLRITHP